MAKVKIPHGMYTKEFREDAVRLEGVHNSVSVN